MGSKRIDPKTKAQALDLLGQGGDPEEVAIQTGVSKALLQRWKNQPNNAGTTPQNSNGTGSQATALDFEESPAPIVERGPVESALSSLKGMLGIPEKGKRPTPLPLSGKLNAKQQRFVDAAAPTVALATIALASWIWTQIGPEYTELAPDEAVARRITEPLLRVYARHQSFLVDVNPDMADILTSTAALVGYAHVSLRMYAHIKSEKEFYEQEGHYPGNGNGHTRTGPREPESRPGHASDRYADVRRGGGQDADTAGGNGGTPPDIDSLNLSDKEARQHAALSRLSQLDFEHRARRSGRS